MTIAMYQVLLKSDNGIVTYKTISTSESNAIATVLKTANAPSRAIVSVRVLHRPVEF